MLRYPALFQVDGASWLVTFRDIPEAITFVDGEDGALAVARDALETAMSFYFEDRRCVPLPSDPLPGERLVDLPVSLSAKVLLLNEMITQRVRPAELARRLKTSPQEVNRLTDLRHTTRIDGISAAFAALGKRLDMQVVQAG